MAVDTRPPWSAHKTSMGADLRSIEAIHPRWRQFVLSCICGRPVQTFAGN